MDITPAQINRIPAAISTITGHHSCPVWIRGGVTAVVAEGTAIVVRVTFVAVTVPVVPVTDDVVTRVPVTIADEASGL